MSEPGSPHLAHDRPPQPESAGAASGSEPPPSAAARARNELRHAAQAARALYGDAGAVIDAGLDRAGRSLGRGVWAGVRMAVLLGAILLVGVAGGVLVCIGGTGLLASSLGLGPDATLLLQGSALLACAAIAAGVAWLVRRRRQAALRARQQAAHEALATSARDLAGAVARAADPRPLLEEHPVASLAAALAAALAASAALRRRHDRSPRPASASDAPLDPTAPANRASGSDSTAQLAALVLSLAVPLVERLLEGEAPAEDAHD